MRLLMLISVICFVVALLGQIGTIAGVDVLAWALAGWLAWAVDVLLGGYLLPIGTRRPQ